MKKGKKTRRTRIGITAAVTALILLIAFFCYQTVKKTIVNNEKESMAGIARVSAHSLETSLKAKSNLVYAALSGDMDNDSRSTVWPSKEGRGGLHNHAITDRNGP